MQFFHNLYGPVFEYFFVTVLQYRYKLMCGLNTCNKLHEKFSDKECTFGGRPLPEVSTTDSIKSIMVRINFIDKYFKALA